MVDEKFLSLEHVRKVFDGEVVLEDLNLDIKKGEFLTLLGPSGCGKTTTLRLIGGFTQADSGKILFEGRDITNLKPNERRVNTVFQKYALFPHLNVYENIAFGLRLKKTEESVVKKKVAKMLELVNLTGFANRDVTSLSGGQQQRIAIARALVNEPQVLLLDEPLGALDNKLRKGMQTELINMQWELGITFIFVTHDQEEALSMSDRIVVMNNGRIEQMGKPIDIYNEPVNSFVADFIGESNIIEGVYEEDYKVSFEGATFDCIDTGFSRGEKVDVVLRPEDILISKTDNGKIKGVVENEIFRGVHYEILVNVNGKIWKVRSTDSSKEDSEVWLDVDAEDIHIMRKSNEED
ncbi:MAG: ABC transporter ATP-binding protein [Ezakiella sp.]|nr:ABC transporter ATP-binding protein [Ezakiella sp.]MDD7761580.1 ABC transporter ATP-binding protein [Bacillota bacterium]MDY3947345.1 ABC transporter ATP-binding protein [Ezakiella sp.]